MYLCEDMYLCNEHKYLCNEHKYLCNEHKYIIEHYVNFSLEHFHIELVSLVFIELN